MILTWNNQAERWGGGGGKGSTTFFFRFFRDLVTATFFEVTSEGPLLLEFYGTIPDLSSLATWHHLATNLQNGTV